MMLARNGILLGTTVALVCAIVLVWNAEREGRPTESDTGSDKNSVIKYIELDPEYAEITNGEALPTSDSQVPEVKPVEKHLSLVDHDVPFAIQAPGGDWKNARYQDGCEEASVLMAFRWLEGKKITDAKKELDTISRAMEKQLETFHDTSMEDTFAFVQRYAPKSDATLLNGVTIDQMIVALREGKILVTATNGRKLGNPNFTSPGPEYHMLVVRGYDPASDEFITNDPGTRRGEGYRYKSATLFSAMQNYRTGHHEGTLPEEKMVIAFGKQ